MKPTAALRFRFEDQLVDKGKDFAVVRKLRILQQLFLDEAGDGWWRDVPASEEFFDIERLTPDQVAHILGET